MSEFQRPLVALSMTEADADLLAYAAIAFTPAVCEEIRFTHVVRAGQSGRAPDALAGLTERLQAEVRKHFGSEAANLAFDVVEGERLDQILSLAAQHSSDVILLGHHREHSGWRSLARHLVMVAPCSIWMVPEGAPCTLGNILVPVDFSSHSRDALTVAASLAAGRGLKSCRALHVFFDPSTIRYDEHVDEVVGNQQAAFDEMLAGVDCHGVGVELVLEESPHTSEAILRVAERTAADLIVLNTRGRSRAAAVLLGSVTADTIAATSIPLLAVKHFGSRLTLFQALANHRFWEEPPLKAN